MLNKCLLNPQRKFINEQREMNITLDKMKLGSWNVRNFLQCGSESVFLEKVKMKGDMEHLRCR